MTATTKKIGRPTKLTSKLAKEICDVIASSNKGLNALCKEHKNWPNPDTIYQWRKAHKDFSEQYTRAKQAQIEVLVDDMLSIADDSSNDYVTNDEGEPVINHEHLQRAKLRIDTRKWLAAKLCPRLYGDKPEDKPEPSNKPVIYKIDTLDPVEASKIYQSIMTGKYSETSSSS